MAGQHTSDVQSVARAIAILKSFSLERPERGVSELSRELGLHKSTVSRLMKTLAHGGLLARSPETERYRLGVDLIGLGAQVISFMDVREVALPFLRALAETCQETVNLSVLNGGQVVNLEQFVPQERWIKNIGRIGRRMAPHCTAAGKVLLAYLPPHERELILRAGLKRFTPHSITDPDVLRQELAQVHEQSYATAREELEAGLNVVAAPVRDHTGRVVASISVAGPAFRLSPDLFPEIAALLKDTTAAISKRLGYKQ